MKKNCLSQEWLVETSKQVVHFLKLSSKLWPSFTARKLCDEIYSTFSMRWWSNSFKKSGSGLTIILALVPEWLYLYCISMKSCLICIRCSLYTNGQDILGIQHNLLPTSFLPILTGFRWIKISYDLSFVTNLVVFWSGFGSRKDYDKRSKIQPYYQSGIRIPSNAVCIPVVLPALVHVAMADRVQGGRIKPRQEYA